MSAASCVEMVVAETLPSNATYTGRLVNNQRDGSGTSTSTNGEAYDGEWRCDVKHGRGVHKWPSGGTYEGEWHNGKRDGWGVYHYAEGARFEGLWRDGRRAKGRLRNSNKVDVKDGEWAFHNAQRGSVMQGWGVQRRKVGGDGDAMETVYEGEWDSDQWHGRGTWRSLEGLGDIYHGVFDHGKKSGNGSMLYGTGGTYVGEWKDDMFHGRGVRLWANGDRYEGQWVCGKENGEGTKMLACDCSSFTGLWEMGVPKKGTRRWANGDMFEGTFAHGGSGLELRGEGVATLPWHNMVQLRGLLKNNNMFQQRNCNECGTFVPQQYKMGSPPFEMIEALKTEHMKEMKAAKNQWEKEDESIKRQHLEQLNHLNQKIEDLGQNIQQLQAQNQKQLQKYEDEARLLPLKESSGNNSGNKSTSIITTEPVLPELMEAFKLATQFRTQLKESAPEFVLIEESLNEITKNLQGATQHNEGLTSHLRDLSVLKDTLGKQLDETCNTCQKVLGQTLTAQNRTENLLKPTPEYILSGNSKTTPRVEPFHSLAQLTDTLTQLQGCRFEECTKLANQHTTLSKELSEQITLGHNLHKQIEEMQVSCSELVREHKTKWVLMRGLEGD
ncbi:2-isopropylmalate synthase [Pelomyxa schiedti]|nr:2-isopropylmalate synthase [Pelomyxa schiedti]